MKCSQKRREESKYLPVRKGVYGETHQSITKLSHCNKYFILLAFMIRIGEYWPPSFFGNTSIAARSINLQE